jgi:MFS family permease
VPVILLAQGLGSLLLVVMGFAPVAELAGGLWIARTIAMNSSWPVQQAYIMGIVEPSERSTASSLTYACWSIAAALTPPIGGLLLATHHFTAPFVLGGVCYVVAMAVFYWNFRAVHPARSTQGASLAAGS